MQGMARWAAMALNRFQQGHDGKTALQRQTGRQCNPEVVPFGEKVMHKESKNIGEKKRIVDNQSKEGVWLGHIRSSTEVLIGTKQKTEY